MFPVMQTWLIDNKGLLLMLLERPLRWPEAAVMFSEAVAGNGTLLFNMLTNPVVPLGPTRLAVTCLDSPPPRTKDDFPTAEDLADELIKTMVDTSVHFGMSVGVGEPDGGCQFWQVQGPERFTGPWNATLKIPMLITSNTVWFHRLLIHLSSILTNLDSIHSSTRMSLPPPLRSCQN